VLIEVRNRHHPDGGRGHAARAEGEGITLEPQQPGVAGNAVAAQAKLRKAQAGGLREKRPKVTKAKKDKTCSKVLRFWLHTSFLPFDGSEGVLVLSKAELDDLKKDAKKHRLFPEGFYVEVNTAFLMP